MKVARGQDYVDVKIVRKEGADGEISCMFKTEQFIEGEAADSSVNAQDFQDYMPKHEQIKFATGEEEKIIQIQLINKKVPLPDKTEGKEDDAEEDEDELLAQEKKFKIRLENAKPDNVKISRHNLCQVTILPAEKHSAVVEHQKLVEYFLEQKDITWGQQFIRAVTLSPTISEDNMVTEPVTLGDALSHFVSITWKVLFACVPPSRYCGGYFAFFVALVFIGVVTMIVGDVAKILGCVCGLKESVTAITLVAMGTSLPDTFASMSVAKTSDCADAAIGNVTGSNSVNIFLGLGLPWIIAAHYAASNN